MATSTTKRTDAQLEAAEYYFGGRHCRSWTAVANTADALDGLYLPVNYVDPENFAEVLGYIHLEGTAAAADPAPAGKTLLAKATFATGDSAAVVAAAVDTALSALTSKVFSSVASDVFTIENRIPGAITDETDEDSTGFTEAVEVTGFGGFLGQSDGGAELATETTTVIINSDQDGSLELAEIVQGTSATLTVGLQEMTNDRWDQVVARGAGDSKTPAGGTKVVGFGESKQFENLADSGGMLVLHPIRLARTDRTADVVFWRSNGKLTGINFSGADKQVGQTEWKAYLDAAYDTKINLFAYGDWTQDEMR